MPNSIDQILFRSLIVPNILWNPKAHYHVHSSQLPLCILRQINSHEALRCCFCKTNVYY